MFYAKNQNGEFFCLKQNGILRTQWTSWTPWTQSKLEFMGR